MKSKRVLATVLSVVMLVASLPCIVLAAPETPEIDLPETEPTVSYVLTEGVVQTIDSIASDETKIVSFTPSANGRYGFMCAYDGYDVVASVTDQYGTTVVPTETESFNDGFVQYLTLDAGMKYLFSVYQYEGSSSSNVRLMIGRSSKTLHLGSTYAFGKTSTTKEMTFTPSESGVYVFNVTSQEKIDGRIHLGGYDYIHNKDYSRTSVYLYGYLTGGVTYPLILNLDQYDNPDYVVNPMKITVTKNLPALSDGPNTVTVKADNQETYFQYTPQEDGVYLIYTEGDHSTRFWMDGFPREYNHYGEGDNFRTGVCLKAGQTYFPTIMQSGSSEADINVYIEKAPEITSPEIGYGYHVGSGEAAYFSYTPSKAAFYRLDTNVTSVSVGLVKYGQDDWNSNQVYYLNEGETYLIFVENPGIGNINFAWLYVTEITDTVTTGDSSVDNSNRENKVYALFKPQSTGKYTVTIPVEYARLGIYAPQMRQLSAKGSSDSQGVTAEYSFTAGETYLLEMHLGDAGYSLLTVPVQITKDTLTELGTGNNPVNAQSFEETYYSFTPTESGLYEFCYYLYPSDFAPEVYDGSESIVWLGYSYDSYHVAIVELEANKEYTVVMPRTNNYTSETTLYIGKVQQLTPGTENQVVCPMPSSYRPFFTMIQPSESGIYTISNGSSDFWMCDVQPYLGGIDSDLSRVFTSDGARHYLLEAGKIYIATMSVTDDTNPVPVTLTLDQKLDVGTNSVSLPAPEDENNPYSYFSFTPSADGRYCFSIESTDLNGKAISATLNSKESRVSETWGYVSNGVIWFDAELKKGETYRLALKADPNPDGYDIDIVVSATLDFEEKLEGYSLSLDGTIAVNLYMKLSDSIAESADTRLNVSFENGTSKTYSMSDATTDTYNGKKYYVFHIPVAAKEMTAAIKAQIVNGEFEGNEYTLTVQNYAKYILDHAYTAWGGVADQAYYDAAPLVKALLNYGAYSQKYFGYKTGALANSILKDEDTALPELEPKSIPGYDSSLTSLPSGVTFKSVSLSLKSETELNLVFTNTTGKELSFTTDNESVNLKVTKSDGQTKLKITGIPAHKVNEAISLNVFLEGDSNTYYVSYSPIYYCRNQIERPVTETRPKTLKDLMTAFYLYNQAARNYIDN